MSIAAYADYRESGIDWLGEVPSHWEVIPLKRRFSVTLGKMLQSDAKSDVDFERPYLRAANIKWGKIDTDDLKTMWFSPHEANALELRLGDLLVSEGGDVGRSAIWQDEVAHCHFQNSVNRVRSISESQTRFLFYWMATIKAKGYVDVLCNKSTIAHFTAEKVAAVPIPVPTPHEQAAITTFLDRETAKIDGLVAEQERLIALLKEKRQAVISHAVTKGLNPNAPMKDSGIEWLGEIPAHWETMALKRLGTLRSGEAITSDAIEEEGQYPVFGGNGFRGFTTDYTHIGEYVLIGRQGALCGNINYANGDFWASEHAIVVNPQQEYSLTWLGELLRHMNLGQYSQSAAQPGLSAEFLSNLYVPVPPLSEQQEIGPFLAEKIAQSRELATEAQAAIALLQERRAALISAAVTGKIDVRGLVMLSQELEVA